MSIPARVISKIVNSMHARAAAIAKTGGKDIPRECVIALSLHYIRDVGASIRHGTTCFGIIFTVTKNCASLKDFRQSLKRKDGLRVDHVGGLPAQTDVRRLALHSNDESCSQGGAQKKTLRQTGKGVQLQRRLQKRAVKQKRVLKRPAQNRKASLLFAARLSADITTTPHDHP